MRCPACSAEYPSVVVCRLAVTGRVLCAACGAAGYRDYPRPTAIRQAVVVIMFLVVAGLAGTESISPHWFLVTLGILITHVLIESFLTLRVSAEPIEKESTRRMRVVAWLGMPGWAAMSVNDLYDLSESISMPLFWISATSVTAACVALVAYTRFE